MKGEIIKAAISETVLIMGFMTLYFSDYYEQLSKSTKTTLIIVFIAAIMFVYGRFMMVLLKNKMKK